MCGEKTSAIVAGLRRGGSPPRVRGKGGDTVFIQQYNGITPACAGKSCEARWRARRIRDHPRVCGEKQFFAACAFPCVGSPPRVRGKVERHLISSLSGGITPACAGKSEISKGLVLAKKDHPRVCGEKPQRRFYSVEFVGSPPRVRGKAAEEGRAGINDGITPACAGKRTPAVWG